MNPNIYPNNITQFCRSLYTSTMVRIWVWRPGRFSSTCSLPRWTRSDHKGRIVAIQRGGGGSVLTAALDGRIIAWDAETGEFVFNIPKPRDLLRMQSTSLLVGGFKHFLFSIIHGIILPIDYYFSEGLKPPTRIIYQESKGRTKLPLSG